ncbi:hypothetical protein ACNKHR_17665 [Shigella flexneri]
MATDFHRITCVKWLGGNRINRPAENHTESAAGYRAGADYPTEAELSLRARDP